MEDEINEDRDPFAEWLDNPVGIPPPPGPPINSKAGGSKANDLSSTMNDIIIRRQLTTRITLFLEEVTQMLETAAINICADAEARNVTDLDMELLLVIAKDLRVRISLLQVLIMALSTCEPQDVISTINKVQ